MKILSNIDLNGNKIQNSGFETVTSLPTTGNFDGWQVLYQGKVYTYYNGAWRNSEQKVATELEGFFTGNFIPAGLRTPTLQGLSLERRREIKAGDTFGGGSENEICATVILDRSQVNLKSIVAFFTQFEKTGSVRKTNFLYCMDDKSTWEMYWEYASIAPNMAMWWNGVPDESDVEEWRSFNARYFAMVLYGVKHDSKTPFLVHTFTSSDWDIYLAPDFVNANLMCISLEHVISATAPKNSSDSTLKKNYFISENGVILPISQGSAEIQALADNYDIYVLPQPSAVRWKNIGGIRLSNYAALPEPLTVSVAYSPVITSPTAPSTYMIPRIDHNIPANSPEYIFNFCWSGTCAVENNGIAINVCFAVPKGSTDMPKIEYIEPPANPDTTTVRHTNAEIFESFKQSINQQLVPASMTAKGLVMTSNPDLTETQVSLSGQKALPIANVGATNAKQLFALANYASTKESGLVSSDDYTTFKEAAVVKGVLDEATTELWFNGKLQTEFSYKDGTIKLLLLHSNASKLRITEQSLATFFASITITDAKSQTYYIENDLVSMCANAIGVQLKLIIECADGNAYLTLEAYKQLSA